VIIEKRLDTLSEKLKSCILVLHLNCAHKNCIGDFMNTRGLYITFSGIDGAGKSTIAKLINRNFILSGHETYICSEYENFSYFRLRAIASKLKVDVREYFGTNSVELSMALDSLRTYDLMIWPLVNQGTVVVADRDIRDRIPKAKLFGATNIPELEQLLLQAAEPDFHFVFTLSIDEAMKRIEARGMDYECPNILEAFQNHIVSFYQKSKNTFFIDAGRELPAVYNDVLKILNDSQRG
jgi:thymidylate kinase